MSQTSHYCDTRPTATKVTCLHPESFPREVCRSVPSLAPDMSEVSHRAWAQLSGWPGQGWCPDHSGHAGASVSGREFCCHTVCVLARRMGTTTRGEPQHTALWKRLCEGGRKDKPRGQRLPVTPHPSVPLAPLRVVTRLCSGMEDGVCSHVSCVLHTFICTTAIFHESHMRIIY